MIYIASNVNKEENIEINIKRADKIRYVKMCLQRALDKTK